MKTFKEDYSKKLQQFKKKGDNMKCFECNQKGTTYICTTFGTFVCSDCAGILSHLNYKVKGLGVATFNKNEYEFISKNGNDIAKRKWMAKFDINKDKYPKPKNYEEIRKNIINKYQFKIYYDDSYDSNEDKSTKNKENEKIQINENKKDNTINSKKINNDYNNFNFDNTFKNNTDSSSLNKNYKNSDSNNNENKFDFNNFDFN